MEPLVSKSIKTDFGIKNISVYHTDICDLNQNIDVLVLSAFKNSYAPVEGTVIGAIHRQYNISVELLAMHPTIDLRNCSGVWLSKPFVSNAAFKRIACVEIKNNRDELLDPQVEKNVFSVIKTLFYTLTIASINGIPIETVAIPALGANAQNLDLDIVMTPLLNECINFLKQCDSVKHILLYENSPTQAFKIARMVDDSYKLLDYQMQVENRDDSNYLYCEKGAILQTKKAKDKPELPIIFISYSSKDYDIMIKVNEMLEKKGIKTWFAPRNVILSSYASSIVKGIKDSNYFLVILSENSMKSRHVMNELDLAFSELSSDNKLIPVKLDQTELNDAFRYYLSRLEWYQLKMHPNGTNLTALEDVINQMCILQP